MKERPILFSGAMVRALLDGSKTQTRRVLKQATGPSLSVGIDDAAPGVAELSWLWGDGPGHDVHETTKRVACPYGQPGDRLWVRESWQFYDWTEDGQPCVRFAADNASKWPLRIPEEQADRLTEIWAGLSDPENYSIDNRARDRRWRPSIHMPRWASRITLEITGVRVERLQDISEADAAAEGVHTDPACPAYDGYRTLWEQINGPGSWGANPWVWVVEFRRALP